MYHLFDPSYSSPGWVTSMRAAIAMKPRAATVAKAKAERAWRVRRTGSGAMAGGNRLAHLWIPPPTSDPQGEGHAPARGRPARLLKGALAPSRMRAVVLAALLLALVAFTPG